MCLYLIFSKSLFLLLNFFRPTLQIFPWKAESLFKIQLKKEDLCSRLPVLQVTTNYLRYLLIFWLWQKNREIVMFGDPWWPQKKNFGSSFWLGELILELRSWVSNRAVLGSKWLVSTPWATLYFRSESVSRLLHGVFGLFWSILGLLGTPIGPYMAQRPQIHTASPRIWKKTWKIIFNILWLRFGPKTGPKRAQFSPNWPRVILEQNRLPIRQTRGIDGCRVHFWGLFCSKMKFGIRSSKLF